MVLIVLGKAPLCPIVANWLSLTFVCDTASSTTSPTSSHYSPTPIVWLFDSRLAVFEWANSARAFLKQNQNKNQKIKLKFSVSVCFENIVFARTQIGHTRPCIQRHVTWRVRVTKLFGSLPFWFWQIIEDRYRRPSGSRCFGRSTRNCSTFTAVRQNFPAPRWISNKFTEASQWHPLAVSHSVSPSGRVSLADAWSRY